MDCVKLRCRGKMFHWHFGNTVFLHRIIKEEVRKTAVTGQITLDLQLWLHLQKPNDAILVQCDNNTMATKTKHTVYPHT